MFPGGPSPSLFAQLPLPLYKPAGSLACLPSAGLPRGFSASPLLLLPIFSTKPSRHYYTITFAFRKTSHNDRLLLTENAGISHGFAGVLLCLDTYIFPKTSSSQVLISSRRFATSLRIFSSVPLNLEGSGKLRCNRFFACGK